MRIAGDYIEVVSLKVEGHVERWELLHATEAITRVCRGRRDCHVTEHGATPVYPLARITMDSHLSLTEIIFLSVSVFDFILLNSNETKIVK